MIISFANLKDQVIAQDVKDDYNDLVKEGMSGVPKGETPKYSNPVADKRNAEDHQARKDQAAHDAKNPPKAPTVEVKEFKNDYKPQTKNVTQPNGSIKRVPITSTIDDHFSEALANGTMRRAISHGIDNVKHVGKIVKNTGKIFNAQMKREHDREQKRDASELVTVEKKHIPQPESHEQVQDHQEERHHNAVSVMEMHDEHEHTKHEIEEMHEEGLHKDKVKGGFQKGTTMKGKPANFGTAHQFP